MSKRIALSFILLISMAALASAQSSKTKSVVDFLRSSEGAPATVITPPDSNALAPVVPAPKESRLTWENHRLRSANIRAQIQNLQLQLELLPKQADAEDKAADLVLEEMQKAIGEKYGPRINSAGLLEFALKDTKAEVVSAGSTTVPKDKKSQK